MPPLREWPWLAEAAVRLAGARFMIRFVPFPLWRGQLGTLAGPPRAGAASAADKALACRIGRYVRGTAARVPFNATCLPQAIAARWMLRARGVESELYIGARPARPSSKRASPIDLHAWLMLDEVCVTGGATRADFSALQ